MAEEQCSFDELSALLDSDDDILLSEMTEKSQDSTNDDNLLSKVAKKAQDDDTACLDSIQQGSPPINGIEDAVEEKSHLDNFGNETSDDDIDEDELDKLAGLMEMSEKDDTKAEGEVADDSSGVPPVCPGEDSSREACGNHGDVSVCPEEDSSREACGNHSDVSEDEESSNDVPDTAVLEELRRMQEKMAFLEAQLKKKKAKDKAKSPKQPKAKSPKQPKAKSPKQPKAKSPKQPSKRSDSDKGDRKKPGQDNILGKALNCVPSAKSRVHVDTPRPPFTGSGHIDTPRPPVTGSDGKSKTKSALNKKVSPPKLQMLEEDIFSSDHVEIDKPCRDTSTKKASLQNGHSKPKGFYGNKSNSSSNKPGNDSDSDWEGMDGYKPSDLNKAGKELKGLIKQGARDRMAHAASYDTETAMESRQTARSWKEKPAKASTSYVTAVAGISAVAAGATSKPKPVEKGESFGGIQVIKPLVSTNTFISMTDGRKFIKMSRIHCKTKGFELQDDWVTVGVIVNKSEPKMSSKGKQFSIWKLSDLDDCDITVSLFLFNNVHTTHWKIQPGSVIGLLNASVLPNNDKYKGRDNDVSLTLDAPQKLLLMGRSRDFGLCRGRTKNGKECLNFVNKSRAEYCTYHIQAAYKKQSAKRPDLQAGYTGVTPKSMEQRLLGNKKGQSIIYGGQSFSTAPVSNKKKDRPTIKSLQAFHTTMPATKKGKVTTLQLHELVPMDASETGQTKDEKNKNFHELMTLPTVGSMNYITHLKKTENIKEKEKDKSVMAVPIKPKDLLIQHGMMMKEKRKKHELAKRRESPGTPRPVFNGGQPRLGSDLSPGDDLTFDLDDLPPLQPQNLGNQARVKQKALEKLKAKGGVQKQDPNAVKKQHQSADIKEKIRKRASEVPEDEENLSCESQPPKKKKKLGGTLDLASPEVQRLLKARSKYDGALTEMEEEKFDQYFDTLEKTEQMEEKMDKIKEQKCIVFSCSVCNYTAFAPSKRCKEENHKVKRTEATKRFFQCKNCKNRTTHYDRLPPPCKNCGQQNFERVSMLRVKKGPKLPGEELVLRGEELKNLNTLS